MRLYEFDGLNEVSENGGTMLFLGHHDSYGNSDVQYFSRHCGYGAG